MFIIKYFIELTFAMALERCRLSVLLKLHVGQCSEKTRSLFSAEFSNLQKEQLADISFGGAERQAHFQMHTVTYYSLTLS